MRPCDVSYYAIGYGADIDDREARLRLVTSYLNNSVALGPGWGPVEFISHLFTVRRPKASLQSGEAHRCAYNSGRMGLICEDLHVGYCRPTS